MSASVGVGAGEGPSLETAWSQAEAGLGYVSWLARDFLYTGVSREDLESEGRLGLLDAALRFDPAHGVQFITYASWRARRRMQLFAVRHSRIVRRPVRARATGADGAEVSIDDPVGAGASRRWSDVLADPAARPPVAELLLGEETALVARAVGELPPLWAHVVALRFGLHDGDPPMTLRAIGARLSLSRERVRQIEAKSLRRMRAIVESSGGTAS
jgi:RNA polymerase sigma factor (sigma-70 family)